MRLFVLGATGRMGQLLVLSALARGHEITAFVRSPGKMAAHDRGLTVVGGDPLAADQLASALPHHDAVISAFGPRGRDERTVCEQFGRALVHAMDASDVGRLVVTSTGLLFRGNVLASVLAATVFRHVVADLAAMERCVTDSARGAVGDARRRRAVPGGGGGTRQPRRRGDRRGELMRVVPESRLALPYAKSFD